MNVVIYQDHEIPFSDEQIEQLEREHTVEFYRWDGQEAFYQVTDQMLRGCYMIGIDPLEALVLALDNRQGIS
jgi:hypothetical protein